MEDPTLEEALEADESARSLASVQIVEHIDPHPNADRLELATILGWQVIITKGEAEIGQKVVYCEIDSQLPWDAEWLPTAVRNRVKKGKPFPIKTIKLRGELSQGLIVPMDNFEFQEKDFPIDTDMTEKLKIEKYRPKIFGGRLLW